MASGCNYNTLTEAWWTAVFWRFFKCLKLTDHVKDDTTQRCVQPGTRDRILVLAKYLKLMSTFPVLLLFKPFGQQDIFLFLH